MILVKPWVYVLAVRIRAGGGCYVEFGWKSSSVLKRAGGSSPVLPRILGCGSRGWWVIVQSGALVAVEGERLSVQLQRYTYDSLLPQEGSAPMCWMAARLGAQWWVSLTPSRGRRIQRRLLSIKTCVVIVRGLGPIKRLAQWTAISTLLQGSCWRSFSLR